MAITKAVSSKAGIGTAIDYVTKEEKIEEKLVTGIDCSPGTAKEEMQATKELWQKTGGREYKHFTISYAPGENITTDQAHKNALELVKNTKALAGHECLIATHKDKKHIHTHIIVNSVNHENGYKLQWSKYDLADLKVRTNEQSLEQGLHVPEKGRHFDGTKNNDVTTWNKDKYMALEKAFGGDYKSHVLEIANAVADARVVAGSQKEFEKLMSEKGIKTEWKDSRKNIVFETAEGKKVRNSNLTKTFKVDFGKESLTDEFQRNAERNSTTERAEQQIRAAGKKTEPSTGRTGSHAGTEKSKNPGNGRRKVRAELNKLNSDERGSEEIRENSATQRVHRDDVQERLDRERERKAQERQREVEKANRERAERSRSRGFER